MIISGGREHLPGRGRARGRAAPGRPRGRGHRRPAPALGRDPRRRGRRRRRRAPRTAEVLEFIKGDLASYKKPSAVVYVDELPRNASGKILKRDLRDSFGAPVRGTGLSTQVATRADERGVRHYDVPLPVDLVDGLRETVAGRGDRLAYVTAAGRYTWNEVAVPRSTRLARRLAGAGVVAGDRVAVLAGNGLPFTTVVFAAWRLRGDRRAPKPPADRQRPATSCWPTAVPGCCSSVPGWSDLAADGGSGLGARPDAWCTPMGPGGSSLGARRGRPARAHAGSATPLRRSCTPPAPPVGPRASSSATATHSRTRHVHDA